MSRKLVLVMTLMIIFAGMLALAFDVQPVRASETIYIRADGSIDPPSAPVFTMDSVTYVFTDNVYDAIVVERNNIIVDGKGYTLQVPEDEFGFYLSGIDNVTIRNVNIISGVGLILNFTSRILFSQNNITANVWYTQNIILFKSSDNTISGNNITGNGAGVYLYNSSYNNISENNIINNLDEGIMLDYSSSKNIVSGNNVTNNYVGIDVKFASNNNTICRNDIKANRFAGIWLSSPFNNEICENNIAENDVGIQLTHSSSNTFHHNNVTDNLEQVFFQPGYVNSWDNGFEGNYWSNYTGVDSDHDGIGDSPHVINEDNQDNYPLMGMFHSFNTSLGCDVNVISNSSIEYFTYFESNSTVKMYVSNIAADQTHGFCRVCIAHALMDVSNITVIIDRGLTEVLNFNETIYNNGTHRWIYFAYPHLIHEIDIITEFPSFLITPLFMLATLMSFIVYRRKYTM